MHEAATLFVKQLPCSLNALQTTGSQQPVNAQADGTTHARQPQAARTMGRRRKETCNSQGDLREQNRKAKQKLMQENGESGDLLQRQQPDELATERWRPVGDSNPCTHRERVMS